MKAQQADLLFALHTGRLSITGFRYLQGHSKFKNLLTDLIFGELYSTTCAGGGRAAGRHTFLMQTASSSPYWPAYFLPMQNLSLACSALPMTTNDKPSIADYKSCFHLGLSMQVSRSLVSFPMSVIEKWARTYPCIVIIQRPSWLGRLLINLGSHDCCSHQYITLKRTLGIQRFL